jgi:UDP-N-acetylmuramoyl-L-alanyl-D-glutamate--2,6-diaminopimelate ligase
LIRGRLVVDHDLSVPSTRYAPSAHELSQFGELEAQAAQHIAGSLLRPTRAPFDWAEPLCTVGVTGTNGKSSTTHLIARAIAAAGHSVLTESTLGYWFNEEELAVPRTSRGYLAALREAAERGARHAVCEVTSAALARGFARVWRYDLAVFTNLSRDHVEAHGSWEHYLASKAQLFVHLGPGCTAVLNACDPAALLLERVTPADVKRQFFALDSRGDRLVQADLAAQRVSLDASGTRIELERSPLAEALGAELTTQMIGAVFAENVLAAALAALALNIPAEHVRSGIAACPVVRGRFEVVSRAPIVAIDYAHTPDALARTCDTARALAHGGRVILVCGAGGDKDQQKREPMGRAAGERADWVLITNDNPRHEDPRQIAEAVARGARRGGRAHVQLELDRERAIERALSGARSNDVIVIAGKGHERGQLVAGVELPYSDHDCVARLMAGARSELA